MIETLGPSLATALIASLVFLYLWVRDRKRHLAIWTVAWLLWVVRYAYGLASATFELDPESSVLPMLALARGALFLWGTYAMLDRRVPRGWIAVLSLDFVLIAFEALGATLPLPGPPGVEHYLVFGATLVWAGALFLGKHPMPRFEASVTGYSLVVFGLLQATYPYIGVLPEWYPRIAYVVVHGLQALIPLGILMTYIARAAAELAVLNEALQGSLTQALSEHIPICAHCKSIREGEGWVALERYVSERSTATFSHGVCPTCTEAHYGHLGLDDD